jgi:peptidoglycan L-alanyl-D-glutamate endopeptidase CwlK
MSSRSLDDLTPECKAKALQFVSASKDQGIDILIYCTYRSGEEQDELYAQGRTKPGRIVTKARAGESFHNYRCAFDWVPMVGGKPQWSDSKLYRKAGIIAESVGLEWAGRWTGEMRESAHCQYTGGLSLAQLKAKAGVA